MIAVDVLDRLLDRFEGRYANVFKRLDELLSIEQPTKAQLSEFVNTIPHTHQVLTRSFSKLDHPAWFTGLKKRGMFETCEAWPEGRKQSRDAHVG